MENAIENYNLCDIVRFLHIDRGLSFPEHTIGHRYVKKVRKDLSKHSVDFELLQSIVDDTPSPEPEPDAFYMHCRVGDIFNYMGNNINNHHFPWVDTVFSIIQDNNLNKIYKKCVIVTGSHKKHRPGKSKEYLDNLIAMLENFGLEVNLVSNEADQDLCLLAKARCYIAGYRGFGWLSACMNRNKVYWDIQKPPFFYWESRKGHKRKYIQTLTEGYRYHILNSL